MTDCVDAGRLRAYLDGELPPVERAAVGAHLVTCPVCQAHAEMQRGLARQVRALLEPPAAPDARAALARLRVESQPHATDDASSPAHPFTRSPAQRSKIMQSTSFWNRRRPLVGAIAAVVVLLSLLALPPVRAAADSLLGIFRVQKVMFVPISQDRIKQLQSLKLDGESLFVGKPVMSGQKEPRAVGSAAEATVGAGFDVAQPNLPTPPLSSEYRLVGPGHAEFKVNADTARQVLTMLNIDDVTIPDALGQQPIKVDVPVFVSAHYRGANYDLTLNQGHSPNVSLPEGVDLTQLGTAALRVLGMDKGQAETVSKQINWSNTLLFPFPSDANNIRQVSIGGESGLLVGGGPRARQHWQLYWQSGDKFYMLQGTGAMQEEDMIDLLTRTAESVR